jgi:hypothetical protein
MKLPFRYNILFYLDTCSAERSVIDHRILGGFTSPLPLGDHFPVKSPSMDDTVESRVADWVSAIMLRQEHELHFDELYWTAFDSVRRNCSHSIWTIICSQFEMVISQFRQELTQSPLDSFGSSLRRLCLSIQETISVIADAFAPLAFGVNGLDISRNLFATFTHRVFDSNDPSVHVFLISFTHALPGSRASEKPMIELLLHVLPGTNKWALFRNELLEATDAFCIDICASAMEDPEVSANFAVYLGIVLEVIENEEKLWMLLPSDLAVELREVALNGLVYAIKDDFLFHPRSLDLWRSVFFETIRNVDTLRFLCRTILTNRDIQENLLHCIAGYFIEKTDHLISDVRGRTKSAAVAAQVAEFLIDTFERINLLSAALPANSHSKTIVDEMRCVLLQDPQLKVENCMSAFIGRCIGIICENSGKQRENRYLIRNSAQIIAFMPKRNKFVRLHSHAMNIRLFQSAGTSYRVEAMVLEELQPYLPPTLSQPFEEKVREFQESETVNGKWKVAHPASPLQVFILPAVKPAHLQTAFQNVRLPEPFDGMQFQFEIFLKSKALLIEFDFDGSLTTI